MPGLVPSHLGATTARPKRSSSRSNVTTSPACSTAERSDARPSRGVRLCPDGRVWIEQCGMPYGPFRGDGIGASSQSSTTLLACEALNGDSNTRRQVEIGFSSIRIHVFPTTSTSTSEVKVVRSTQHRIKINAGLMLPRVVPSAEGPQIVSSGAPSPTKRVSCSRWCSRIPHRHSRSRPDASSCRRSCTSARPPPCPGTSRGVPQTSARHHPEPVPKRRPHPT